uniref:Uncharacterized protein n=1 Tax=Cacopsylla melanoneura TaxID=428564 RepID=A0A8D9DUD5_9HEMI
MRTHWGAMWDFYSTCVSRSAREWRIWNDITIFIEISRLATVSSDQRMWLRSRTLVWRDTFWTTSTRARGAPSSPSNGPRLRFSTTRVSHPSQTYGHTVCSCGRCSLAARCHTED